MPSKRRAPSRTVDLTGYDPRDFLHLAAAVVFTDRVWDNLPDVATAAYTRIDAAGHDERGNIYKVPRDSLAALVTFLRQDPQLGSFPILDKLEARLRRSRGRSARADVWANRAARVEATFRKFQREHGYTPTENQVEAALGYKANAISRWRSRHPDIFPRD